MKIGIIFAMSEEINEFKKEIKIVEEYNIYELKFYKTIINNKECILVESGVGKVNAARTTQVLIDNFNPNYIFNIGVAGGIDESLNVCDVVIGDTLVQHDFDITAFNHIKGYIPNIGDMILSDDKLIKLAKNTFKNAKEGVIASGDIFVTNKDMAKKINTKFNALCVEMEGAAIAQVCYLCKIPFLVIRSISDTPNNNNNAITYEEFLEKSSEIVAKSMIKLIEKM